MDMQRWINRMKVVRRRLIDSWMDLCILKKELDGSEESTAVVASFRTEVQLSEQSPFDEGQRIICLERLNEKLKSKHKEKFPLNDNLLALMLIAMSDLSEQQRQNFAQTMSM